MRNSAPTATRRSFLQGGGAALVIGFTLPAVAAGSLRAPSAPGGSPSTRAGGPVFEPNAWLRITSDNRIVVRCAAAEMGQGVLTALPMLLAEELDADWSLVSVQQAPAETTHPVLPGLEATGGSMSVRAHWDPLRRAGAAAREMLVAAAAAQWKLNPASLRTERSRVIGPNGRRLSYGALAAGAARLAVPDQPALKSSNDFKVLGKPLQRLDTPQKLNGSGCYGIDVQLPGLLVAVMARAPMPGAKAVAFNESAARSVEGVRQVHVLPSGVAVLAEGFWAARRGRDALEVEWDLGPLAALSSASINERLHSAAAAADAVARDDGNVRDTAGASGKWLEATYEAPYLAHACLEPMNCTAQVRGDEVEVWVGTQAPGSMQQQLGELTQVAPARIKVHTMLLGGGFGRRFAPDFGRDATRLSQLSGRPVKLIYTREDDMAGGYYRPAAVARLEAALDERGHLTMLSARVASASLMAASGFMAFPDSGVDSFAMQGIADHPYDIAHQRLAYGRAEPGPQVWFWRSGGYSHNVFFIEGFIDELAAAAGRDPFEFRRELLGRQPRCRRVLEVAAERANWGKPLPAGVGRGIAVTSSFGSYVAEVAEVSVAADGTPKVHRIVAAVDCGLTVNPQIVRRQIEGSIAFGLSAALHGRITFQEGRVQQRDFDQYPVLRMHEMPRVDVHIVPSREAPGGVGEPGTPPVAPAVVNALFAATGQRLRSLPIDAGRLRG